MQRRTANGLLLVALSVCACLAVLELVFRLPVVVGRTGGNTPGMLRFEAERYDRIWEQNELGLRSLHVERARRPGVKRILVLGDSFSWGDKIARTEDTWPFVLERELVGAGFDVEVVSLAKGGFTTVNEAERLERLGWDFDPDVLLHQFYLNDPLPSGPGYRREGERWLYRLWPLAPGLHDFLDRRSYLYSFANVRFGALQRRLRAVPDYRDLFREDFAGWQAARSAIASMSASSRARGVPMLGVAFPTFSTRTLSDDGYPYLEVHRAIRDAYAEQGVPFLDLRGTYAAHDPDGRAWWALPCDAHPSIDAHALAARALGRWLRERDILGSR